MLILKRIRRERIRAVEKYYPWILEKIMRFARRTYRIREIGRSAAVEAVSEGGLFLSWHCYLWILAINWAPSHYTALAGVSREGEIISRTLERLGWKVVRGSSSDAALSSLRSMIMLLRQGVRLVMTPDGPQGPPREIKQGAVFLQQHSGLPIIPVGVASKWKYTFSHTWDKSEIPLPGSRICIYYGEPIRDLSGMNRTEAIRLINRALEDANLEAQKY
mgnify:FL=1